MHLDHGRAFETAPATQDALPTLLGTPSELIADGSPAALYMAEFAQAGPAAFISNVGSRPMAVRYSDHCLPVTVEDGTRGASYVTSPHSNYVLYARDEIDIIGIRAGRTLAQGVLSVLDAHLRVMRINHCVHLDNWLLSTSLHGDWKGEGLAEMRGVLADRFPDHFQLIRSIDPFSCPQLLETARADGWTLMPARQIWVTDDLRRDWKKRNNTQNDRRALKKSGLIVEEPSALSKDDCERIATLYSDLYLGRYSAINPIFTARFIEFACDTELLQFRVARNADRQIMAVCGLRVAGQIATVPLLGYDLSRPQSEGLYRIASYLASDYAMERNLRFNGSAGAGKFKAMRGARGQIEYMAVHAAHLSPQRRAGLAVLAASLNGVMKPMLEKQGW